MYRLYQPPFPCPHCQSQVLSNFLPHSRTALKHRRRVDISEDHQNFWHSYITSRSRFREKLTVANLIKKFPSHGTHVHLMPAKTTHHHPTFSFRIQFNNIYPKTRSSLLPSMSQIENLYTIPISLMLSTHPANRILLHFYLRHIIWWRLQTKRLFIQLLATCLTCYGLPYIQGLLHGFFHRSLQHSYSWRG
jgi:hypothetical protein